MCVRVRACVRACARERETDRPLDRLRVSCGRSRQNTGTLNSGCNFPLSLCVCVYGGWGVGGGGGGGNIHVISVFVHNGISYLLTLTPLLSLCPGDGPLKRENKK